MKSIILAGLLFASTAAHAIVADKFKCVMTVNDQRSKISQSSEQNFFVARIPRSSLLIESGKYEPSGNEPVQPIAPSPGKPDFDFLRTDGVIDHKMTFKSKKYTIWANFRADYSHAMKEIEPEARQYSCVNLNVSYCEESNSGSCSSSASACSQFSNPFDPVKGWEKVPYVNGVPIIADQKFTSRQAQIYDDNNNQIGFVTVNCQYLGTVN